MRPVAYALIVILFSETLQNFSQFYKFFREAQMQCQGLRHEVEVDTNMKLIDKQILF